MKTNCFSLILALFAVTTAQSGLAAEGRLLTERNWHLGNDTVKNWPEAPADAEGFSMKLAFEAEANVSEMTLGVTARNVNDAKWKIRINGKPVGELKKGNDRTESFYRLQPGILKQGGNVLDISIKGSQDDITVGSFRLYEETLRELLGLQSVTVAVKDAVNGRALPARITITNPEGELVQTFYAEAPMTAVRKGIVYTMGKPETLELPPGDYLFHATHGTEWSMDTREVELRPGIPALVYLSLEKQVDTPGFVAADTHLHTLTFSGHGDASVEERMVTLAGEGVELAVATDHNHHTDYRPYQSSMGMDELFTSIIGNEVTTRNGHFNSFPFRTDVEIPVYKEDDWVKLVKGIRSKGAQMVILNHPRWPDIARGPFGKFGLNRASGERASGGEFHFDALELINAGTLQPDPFYVCRDWFSLLNHGEEITAVGSSDSHTVGNIVGQGRTYVRSSTDDPSKIDESEMVNAFLRGDTTISMGIVTDLKVNGSHHMGDRIPAGAHPVELNLRVASPHWVNPREAHVFVNGVEVARKAIQSGFPSLPTEQSLHFKLPAQKVDGWLVCVIIGDGVNHPAWRTEQNYTFAATNPVYLDADGDGRFDSPRKTALKLLDKAGPAREAQWTMALSQPDGIAVQMITEMRFRTPEGEWPAFDKELLARTRNRPVFAEYLRYAPRPRLEEKEKKTASK